VAGRDRRPRPRCRSTRPVDLQPAPGIAALHARSQTIGRGRGGAVSAQVALTEPQRPASDGVANSGEITLSEVAVPSGRLNRDLAGARIEGTAGGPSAPGACRSRSRRRRRRGGRRRRLMCFALPRRIVFGAQARRRRPCRPSAVPASGGNRRLFLPSVFRLGFTASSGIRRPDILDKSGLYRWRMRFAGLDGREWGRSEARRQPGRRSKAFRHPSVAGGAPSPSAAVAGSRPPFPVARGECSTGRTGSWAACFATAASTHGTLLGGPRRSPGRRRLRGVPPVASPRAGAGSKVGGVAWRPRLLSRPRARSRLARPGPAASAVEPGVTRRGPVLRGR